MLAVFLAIKRFLPYLRGCHILVRKDDMTLVSYLNRLGGLHSCPQCRLARCVLLWAQTEFLSVRAVHIPGHLNLGADLLSKQALEAREWKLHPQVVSFIWKRFGEVDLFALSMTTHCPLLFSLSPLLPLGVDALAQE